jgi:rubrerythrin
MANDSSRREILVASAALAGGASAALIASCGGGSNTQTTQTVSTIQMQDDAAILNTLLDLESSAVVAYGVIGRHVTGSAVALTKKLRSQEMAHAAALRAAIPKLGEAAASPKSAAEYESTFPALPDQRAAISFALDVEDTAIGAYADAIAKVVTDDVRRTLATIMATEAEHAAVLLGRLGRPQAPDAFVTGPPPQTSSG